MRSWKFLPLVALTLVAAPANLCAQGLTFGLFERYLDALRQQAGIPGLSAAIVSNQQIVWEKGFGFQDVDRLIRASPDLTTYPIGDLTQTFGAALTLKCVEERQISRAHQVRNWIEEFPDTASIGQTLSHADATSAFRYDPARFAALTSIVVACRDGEPYQSILANRVLGPIAMTSTVPGHDVATSLPLRSLFDPATLARYDAALGRLATPYRIDRGRAIPSEFPSHGLNTATGLVSTVRDLASFDIALDRNLVIGADTRAAAWTSALSAGGAPLPTGLGWFVQSYNGRRIVWHFGQLKDAFSSLIIKVPDSGLTLILLANSDGLSSPFPLANGDITTSLFAQLFLRTFVP
jgi:CubicO group peptidase (beta-lactamase class C family)